VRVAVVNVKFSPNLGDGLLAECLEAELRASTPGLETVAIDLAGRTAYGEGGMRNRRAALSILAMMPGPVRRMLVGILLGRTARRTLRPAWRKVMESTDAVVVGGGNLMADNDLNFPIKIRAALAEAKDAGLPVGVFGVGVADNWSQPGQAMFREALSQSRLVHAAVRDQRSQRIWRDRLSVSGVRDAVVCRDPAVLTALHFPAALRQAGPAHVALGVTDPLALRYHSDLPLASGATLTDWIVALVERMVSDGLRVSVFTNGSPEDRTYLDGLAPRLRAVSPDAVEIAPAFATPTELAAFISRHDLVMAHRLHACICAFAYAIPTIGFTWDRKLNSFFESVGRQDYVLEAGVKSIDDTMDLVNRTLAEGVEPTAHAAIVAESRAQVAALAAALQNDGVDRPSAVA